MVHLLVSPIALIFILCIFCVDMFAAEKNPWGRELPKHCASLLAAKDIRAKEIPGPDSKDLMKLSASIGLAFGQKTITKEEFELFTETLAQYGDIESIRSTVLGLLTVRRYVDSDTGLLRKILSNLPEMTIPEFINFYTKLERAARIGETLVVRIPFQQLLTKAETAPSSIPEKTRVVHITVQVPENGSDEQLSSLISTLKKQIEMPAGESRNVRSAKNSITIIGRVPETALKMLKFNLKQLPYARAYQVANDQGWLIGEILIHDWDFSSK